MLNNIKLIIALILTISSYLSHSKSIAFSLKSTFANSEINAAVKINSMDSVTVTNSTDCGFIYNASQLDDNKDITFWSSRILQINDIYYVVLTEADYLIPSLKGINDNSENNRSCVDFISKQKHVLPPQNLFTVQLKNEEYMLSTNYPFINDLEDKYSRSDCVLDWFNDYYERFFEINSKCFDLLIKELKDSERTLK